MKKFMLCVALLMSSSVMQGMEKGKIHAKDKGDVSLSRESLKPLSKQCGNNNQELKNLIEKRNQLICRRMGHIVLAGCCAMFFVYQCNLCPFVSRMY